MATFFGEILPVHSRAVGLDEDDLLDENSPNDERNIEFMWKNESEVCDYVIVAIGPISCAYIHSQNLPLTVIGTLEVEYKSKNHANEKDNKIYRLNDQAVIIITINAPISEQQTSRLTLELFVHIFYKEYLVLTTSNIADYKSATDVPLPFIRCLKTDKASSLTNAPCCPLLESPNFCTGFPASILSRCHIYNKPAILYIVYVEVDIVDSINLRPFSACFINSPIKNFLKEISWNHKDKEASLSTYGNMYI